MLPYNQITWKRYVHIVVTDKLLNNTDYRKQLTSVGPRIPINYSNQLPKESHSNKTTPSHSGIAASARSRHKAKDSGSKTTLRLRGKERERKKKGEVRLDSISEIAWAGRASLFQYAWIPGLESSLSLTKWTKSKPEAIPTGQSFPFSPCKVGSFPRRARRVASRGVRGRERQRQLPGGNVGYLWVRYS